MEPISWAALIASLVGAAASTYGQQQSARAVNKATNEAILNQGAYASKIQQMAQDRAQAYDTSTRKEQQDAITEDLANTYVSQPQTAAQIASDASTTQGDTSADYSKAKEESDARVADSIATFGNLMAKVNGAKTLRQQENWANADAANNIGVQQALMKSQNALDNYKIQQASQKGQGWQTFGSIANLAGTAMSMGATASALANLGKTAGTGAITNAGSGVLNRGATLAADQAMRSYKPVSNLFGL